ncbi:MAG: peptide chain release factor 2 [Oscillospiraceae bacterium]
MLDFEELKVKLNNIKPEIIALKDAVGYNQAANALEEIEQRTAEPGFWDDLDNSKKVLKQQRQLQNKVNSYDKLFSEFEDISTLVEIAMDEDDDSLFDEATAGFDKIRSEIDSVKLSTLLTGEYDANNAILSFHAGAGGTEAQDWAQMLYRMYTRWAERHDFSVKVLDYLDGDEAGLKSACILIEGTNAYGFLKSEAGVHRLVRISPFDSSGRRHTSFASLEVMPEIDSDTEVQINPEDIEFEAYRASGAGGQHINKTSSAVRLTHKPSGIVVTCQTQRSQLQNRDFAMKLLTAKLVEIKEKEHLEKIDDIKGVQKEIAWGAQIRSYVFMPYTMAKDHRTSFESGNIGAVMDGEIDGFINAYLVSLSLGKL